MRSAPLGRHLIPCVYIFIVSILFGWASPTLCLKQVNHGSDVFDLRFNQSFQEHLHVVEFSVFGVFEPCYDFDPVGFLPLKVLFDVVDDDGFLEVSSKDVQVLHVNAVVILGMLAVKSVLDK